MQILIIPEYHKQYTSNFRAGIHADNFVENYIPQDTTQIVFVKLYSDNITKNQMNLQRFYIDRAMSEVISNLISTYHHLEIKITEYNDETTIINNEDLSIYVYGGEGFGTNNGVYIRN